MKIYKKQITNRNLDTLQDVRSGVSSAKPARKIAITKSSALPLFAEWTV